MVRISTHLRRGLGEVTAILARLEPGAEGRVRCYTARLNSKDAGTLVDLLGAEEDTPREIVLAVTAERPERIRVLAVPPPQYQTSSTGEYMRGDIARITGSERSCNIRLSDDGAVRFREGLKRASARMREWLEVCARIPHHGKTGNSVIIHFRPDVDVLGETEDRRLGATAAAMAARTWTAEDFRDWEEASA